MVTMEETIKTKEVIMKQRFEMWCVCWQILFNCICGIMSFGYFIPNMVDELDSYPLDIIEGDILK